MQVTKEQVELYLESLSIEDTEEHSYFVNRMISRKRRSRRKQNFNGTVIDINLARNAKTELSH